jgi:hypothetical protein
VATIIFSPRLAVVPMSQPKNVLDVSLEEESAATEVSDERFDRGEFARRALDLLRPPRMTIAICQGRSRLCVEQGRTWGHGGESWAMLVIPPYASRRAIALAVAGLSGAPRAWVLDTLLGVSTTSMD